MAHQPPYTAMPYTIGTLRAGRVTIHSAPAGALRTAIDPDACPLCGFEIVGRLDAHKDGKVCKKGQQIRADQSRALSLGYTQLDDNVRASVLRAAGVPFEALQVPPPTIGNLAYFAEPWVAAVMSIWDLHRDEASTAMVVSTLLAVQNADPDDRNELVANYLLGGAEALPELLDRIVHGDVERGKKVGRDK